jgi:hypothetical protein
MSQRWYDVCCKCRGQVVRIHDKFGRVHVGRITRVTPNKVYIFPTGIRNRNLGGFGLGYYGYGFGPGFVYGIALGAITGIVLAGLFFW